MLIHKLYWLLVFTNAIVVLLGLPTAVYKVGTPLFVLLMLFMVMNKNKTLNKKIKFPYLKEAGFFLMISFFSKIYNGMDTISYLYFLVFTLLSYLYFIVIVNDADVSKNKKILKFITVLFFIQLPAALIKYLVLGQSEKGGIGTLSLEGGSISTVLPMFAVAVLFSYYLFNKKKSYLIYIFLFTIFAVIGGKRAIIIFFPVIIFLASFLFIFLMKKQINYRKNIRILLSVSAIAFLIIYIGVRLNPTLNPDKELFGSFDLNYVVNYVDSYTTQDKVAHFQMRRKAGLIYFSKYVWNNGIFHALFGEGPGKLVQSRFNERSGKMMDEFGVRYGGRMGYIWLLLQVGYLGAFVYLSLFIKMFIFVWKRFRPHPLYLAFLCLTAVFFIDSVIYSSIFLRFEYVKGVYFFIFALIYLDQKKPERIKT